MDIQPNTNRILKKRLRDNTWKQTALTKLVSLSVSKLLLMSQLKAGHEAHNAAVKGPSQ